MNKWSQLVTEDVFAKNFDPGTCAKSPLRLQASSKLDLSVPVVF